MVYGNSSNIKNFMLVDYKLVKFICQCKNIEYKNIQIYTEALGYICGSSRKVIQKCRIKVCVKGLGSWSAPDWRLISGMT